MIGKLRICGEGGGVGGIRGQVTGFSQASRRRLLDLFNSFDRARIDPSHLRFVTLTYQHAPDDPRACKTHLDTALKRFFRAFGPRALVWKVEPQRRGAPHFHLLVLMGPPRSVASEVTWWAEAWADVIDGSDAVVRVHKGLAGNGNRPCVEVVANWQAAGSYVGKYLGKPCELGDDDEAGSSWGFGRAWGVRHRELLPVCWHEREIPGRASLKVRRVLVRMYERQPTGKVHVKSGGEWHREWVYDRRSGDWAKRLRRYDAEVVASWPASPGRVVVPFRRRWRSRAGGASRYMPAAVFRKLVAWALVDAGMSATDAVALLAEGCNTPQEMGLDRCNTPGYDPGHDVN